MNDLSQTCDTKGIDETIKIHNAWIMYLYYRWPNFPSLLFSSSNLRRWVLLVKMSTIHIGSVPPFTIKPSSFLSLTVSPILSFPFLFFSLEVVVPTHFFSFMRLLSHLSVSPIVAQGLSGQAESSLLSLLFLYSSHYLSTVPTSNQCIKYWSIMTSVGLMRYWQRKVGNEAEAKVSHLASCIL